MTSGLSGVTLDDFEIKNLQKKPKVLWQYYNNYGAAYQVVLLVQYRN